MRTKPIKTIAKALEDFVKDLTNIQAKAQKDEAKAETAADCLKDQSMSLLMRAKTKEQDALGFAKVFDDAQRLTDKLDQ